MMRKVDSESFWRESIRMAGSRQRLNQIAGVGQTATWKLDGSRFVPSMIASRQRNIKVATRC